MAHNHWMTDSLVSNCTSLDHITRYSSADSEQCDLVAFASAFSVMLTQEYFTYDFTTVVLQNSIQDTLGTGASFEVKSTYLDDQSGRRQTNAVSKRAKAVLSSTGTIQDHKRLQSLLSELRTLSHPPLRGHTNIVDLLGLTWGGDSQDSTIIYPIILLEQASRGSLADFLAHQYPLQHLAEEIMVDFMVGVARGLGALHECGIVHGDIKSDNVLVCEVPGSARKLCAKLTDFGCSVVISSNLNYLKLPGGTPPWSAPEWLNYLSPGQLCATDIYSYGLLCWYMYTPLRQEAFKVDSNPLGEIEAFRAVQAANPEIDSNNFLRQFSNILSICLSDDWEIRSILQVLSILAPEHPSPWPVVKVEWKLKWRPYPINATVLPDKSYSRLIERQQAFLAESQISRGKQVPDISTKALNWVRRVLRILHTYDESSIKEVADAISAATTKTPRASSSTPVKSYPGMPAKPLINLAYYHFQSIDARVKARLLNELERVARHTENIRRSAEACFHVAGCYNDGFGTDRDPRKVMSYLEESARRGYVPAQGAVYQLYRSQDKIIPINEKSQIVSWLANAASFGFPGSAENLRELDPELYHSTMHKLRTELCGIGHKLFEPLNLEQAGEPLIKLHYAASNGDTRTVIEILDADAVLVNAPGFELDSSLICACRSGHYTTFKAILKYKPNVRLQNAVGETALHWLTSFPEDHTMDVAQCLAALGADIHCVAEESTVVQPAYLYGYCRGTPLHRAVARNNVSAVEALITVGADPYVGGGYSPTNWGRRHWESPMLCAIARHCPSIVKLFLGHQKWSTRLLECTGAKKDWPPADVAPDDRAELDNLNYLADQDVGDMLFRYRYQSLLHFAVHPERGFNRMMLHGKHVLVRMQETIALLRSLGAKTDFVTAHGRTALYVAVEAGAPDVLQYLLENRARDDIDVLIESTQDISMAMRPLHISILGGDKTCFSLLLDHGADASATWGAGISPLQLCGFGDNLDSWFAERLMAAGISYTLGNALTNYQSPFGCALMHQAYTCATFFLENGASLNEVSSEESVAPAMVYNSTESTATENEKVISNGQGECEALEDDEYSLESDPEWEDEEQSSDDTINVPLTPLGLVLTGNLDYAMGPLQYLFAMTEKHGPLDPIVCPSLQTSALHCIISMNEGGSSLLFERIFHLLLKQFPSSINLFDSKGATPLHRAIEHQNVVAVSALIAAGADPNLSRGPGVDFSVSPFLMALAQGVSPPPKDCKHSSEWPQRAASIFHMLKAAGAWVTMDSLGL